MNPLTKERVKEIFETTESKWEGDNAMQGLKILEKYCGGKDVILGAGHDEVFSISIDIAIENGLTEEDTLQLALLNWSINYGEYFSCFV